MHASHLSFYKRYVMLLNKELRNKDDKYIHDIKITPKSITKICCELPIWGLTCHDSPEVIYIVSPTINLIPKYQRYVSYINELITNKDEINLTVLIDEETKIKTVLYIN